jgi:hypothetical protein
MKKLFVLLLAFVIVIPVVMAGSANAKARPTGAGNIPWNSADWSHTVGHFSTIYVEDHTKAWPVAKAVKAWGSGLHYTRKCPVGANCVRVYSILDVGMHTMEGGTTVVDHHWVGNIDYRKSVRIELNRFWTTGTRNPHQKPLAALSIVTHELGHALDLNHDNRGAGGVMYPYMDLHHNKISAYERNALKRLYGIK